MFVSPEPGHTRPMTMTSSIAISNLAGDADRAAALLALNNAHAAALSWLDPEQLDRLVRLSFLTRVIGEADAFLIALDQSAPYDNPNFSWFRARCPKFVYVDRVVVAEAARGRGLARILYDEPFAAARASGRDIVVCEINLEPPNPASDAFQVALGFTEVGSAFIHGAANA